MNLKIPSKPMGLIPAILTPMNEKFEVDFEQLEDYVKWIIDFDIGGLAVVVDTGEGPQLYPNEKYQVVKAVSEVVKGKVPIVAGLQAINTFDAINQARKLKEAGADALLVFPHPAFIGEPNIEVIYNYHKEVAEKADIPIILFNLQPALGGIELKPQVLYKLIEIDHVIAIKEAFFDAKKFTDIVRVLKKAPRKITILTGNDNFIYESLILGAEGGLLGFGTIATDMQVEMFDLVAKGKYEEAKEIWERLIPLEEVIFAPPVRNYRARLKEALKMLGVLKTTYVRPPLTPISSEEREKIRQVLKSLGLLR